VEAEELRNEELRAWKKLEKLGESWENCWELKLGKWKANCEE
jgi:hypothetical protein